MYKPPGFVWNKAVDVGIFCLFFHGIRARLLLSDLLGDPIFVWFTFFSLLSSTNFCSTEFFYRSQNFFPLDLLCILQSPIAVSYYLGVGCGDSPVSFCRFSAKFL